MIINAGVKTVYGARGNLSGGKNSFLLLKHEILFFIVANV